MAPRGTTAPAPTAETWNVRERAAWRNAPRPKASAWCEQNLTIRSGSRRGAWRHDNAPYLRGLLDITNTPGVVQANLRKCARSGGSVYSQACLGYWGATDPSPCGLALPNRDKGRGIFKSSILPLFRRTAALRALIGSAARDTLTESISLINGFSLELMWSGSAASMASSTFQRVIDDEVDKFEPWTGEEPDAIAATEVRITTYEDRRLQVNVSTPTTTAGAIHRLFEASTVKLHYHVPCPHCGEYQPLSWKRMRWMTAQAAAVHLVAAREAAAAGGTSYAVAFDEDRHVWESAAEGRPASTWSFDTPASLAAHVAWLEAFAARLFAAEGREQLADTITAERDSAIWYECRSCHGRIFHNRKVEIVRDGQWRSLEGPVRDAWGREHVDAEDVTRWPAETRIGFALNSLPCTWIHWGLLVSEWIRAQSNPAALFFFITQRLGEPFEDRGASMTVSIFEAKAGRAPLEEGIVPAWCWPDGLILTCDTQVDGFYGVLRAWGGGMRSARVWHGRLLSFDAIDALLNHPWPVEGGGRDPLLIAKCLIDSGGTKDALLDQTRTQQVYAFAILRQPLVTAIKGSNRPGASLFWPMKNPMSTGQGRDWSSLQALMVDTDQANVLLTSFVFSGLPEKAKPAALTPGVELPPPAVEQWALCRVGPEKKGEEELYAAHMTAVKKSFDPKKQAYVWAPRTAGTRHDYRDCEVYQVVAAHVMRIHLLPDEAETLSLIAAQAAASSPAPPAQSPPADGDFVPRPL